MSKRQTRQESKKRPPKVRSYVRPTKVHTPKPKKRPKYPDKDIEEEISGAYTIKSNSGKPHSSTSLGFNSSS